MCVFVCFCHHYRSLQELLNFQAHHRRVNPVFIISHSLHRQNISGLLCAFSHVYISAYKANIRSLQQLMTYYVFEKEEKQMHMKTLLLWKKPFSHFVLDVETREFKMKTYPYVGPNQIAVSSEGKKNSNKKSALYQGRKMTTRDATAHERAYRFMGDKLVKNSEKALALFDLIYPKLQRQSIDVETLTVTLQKKKNGEATRISLIDYIATLVDVKREPTVLISLFHKYVVTVCHVMLPNTYLANKRFW